MLVSPFHDDVVFVCLPLRCQGNYALPREEACILSPRVSATRRTEFITGRAAANLALKQLGYENPPPVLKGEKGEPLWPKGIVGSISHCGTYAVAAAARSSVAFSMGIDLESPTAIQTDDISPLICHEAERNWLGENEDCRERLVMLFSAKEAVYKAFYPLCMRFIDFKEIRLRWIPEREQFRGELLTSLNSDFTRGYEFDVGCKLDSDWILTYIMLGHRNP